MTTDEGELWMQMRRSLMIADCFYVPHTNGTYQSRSCKSPTSLRMPYICPHSSDSPVLLNELQSMVDRLPRPWEDHTGWDPCKTSRTMRCTWCPTEIALITEPISDADDRQILDCSYQIYVIKFVDLDSMFTPHD